ncbi:MGDG synthase family glycosyltransferase [Desulfitobacterium sp. AusDCA]|uniref:MGDG synthase family glycosyltransferase n=1 Tax=Desulfitobacterium sp. AusDCA TaxID=3240383 RepID=UPI003DA6ED4D
MKPLRILVFSASFGAGHQKAAEAIIETIKNVEPNSRIIHEDFMVLINKALNYVMRNSYIKLIKRAPKLWGRFYNRTQKISEDSVFQRLLNTLGRSQFLKYIDSIQPDVIVCTYPTVAGVLAQLRLNGKLTVPLVTVITDYTVHSQWIHQGVDLYIVGSSKIYDGLVERGIDPKMIQVTGIPVNPRFESKTDKSKILTKLGLEQNRMTFLIMGGAYGVLGKAKWMCKLIAMSQAALQVIVVCGKDRRLYKSLDSVIEEARNPMVRFDFINNVDELMTAADVIITKAGGLTVTEALTKHLPMVIYKPIPGQEENNAHFIQEIGAARIAYTDKEFVGIIDEFIKTPHLLRKMSDAADKALVNHSAEQAVKSILELAADCSIRTTIQNGRELHLNYN